MTVEELINELRKYPQDLQVTVDTYRDEYCSIESVILCEPKDPPKFIILDCVDDSDVR